MDPIFVRQSKWHGWPGRGKISCSLSLSVSFHNQSILYLEQHSLHKDIYKKTPKMIFSSFQECILFKLKLKFVVL